MNFVKNVAASAIGFPLGILLTSLLVWLTFGGNPDVKQSMCSGVGSGQILRERLL